MCHKAQSAMAVPLFLCLAICANTEILARPSDPCASDTYGFSPVLDSIQIVQTLRDPAQSYPRVLCFVNTISTYHANRAQAVADTWGQRCHKLVFFSNVSGTIVSNRVSAKARMEFEVIASNAISDHDNLWAKHKDCLRYVYDHFRHEYDWFYKADDDAYVIMENLQQYLRQPEIYMRYKTQPMHLGHRMEMDEGNMRYYLADPRLKQAFDERYKRWIFHSGGPGYAMNRLFLDQVVSSFLDYTCFPEEYPLLVPDDVAITFCMFWHDVFPWDTRDYEGRERWIYLNPLGAYFADREPEDSWGRLYHKNFGGLRGGLDCCSPDSIAFHYVTAAQMYHMDDKLYFCRNGDADVTE